MTASLETRTALVDASQRRPGPDPRPTAAVGTRTANDRRPHPRHARRVGDVISRLENNGTVTFWRLLNVHRDLHGAVITFEQVR
ncbi:helix-turn-helix DNA-binding domain protein [Gordonia phage Bosnia]|uniref:Helix-turn-helix DNA-binding domain protein n=1 Tax=Gordonia phage Bosnia TaxID=2776839 RepID=A0A7L8ZD94_9CAUD|nr:helix-turn-helix DNA-binding domain protein [Gordonia phage Bosnia]QOI66897.1 helix-turn-helix DNA-binding domain protein [Gordonia phage Bosnia]